jgi:hypothetical protein
MDRPLLGPALPGYALAASHGKAILPEALSIGLLGILLGVLLMGGGLAKRRKVKLALAATTEAAAGTPEESP